MANVKEEPTNTYRFNSFTLDVTERRLTCGETPVRLTPKAFDVLKLFVERNGHLITKDELLNTVWSSSFVEEANIARVIHSLRRTLAEFDDAKFIETVPKLGYRFLADVSESSSEPASSRIHDSDRQPAQAVEIRSARNPRTLLYLAFAAIGLIVATSLTFLYFSSDRQSNNDDRISIAILPFKSLKPESADPIYEHGIPESLIMRLNGARNIIIRPAASTAQLAASNRPAVAVGAEMKVRFLLASSYQIDEGKIRVTSELIDVASEKVVHTMRNELAVTTAFATQDSLSTKIGNGLLSWFGRIAKPTATMPSIDDEAYRFYLQGIALTDRRNGNDAKKAVAYLERSVERDPRFAAAFAALANARNAVYTVGGGDPDHFAKTNDAIEKALAIDDTLSEAYAYRCELKNTYQYDFEGAERDCRKALELDPNSAVAHRLYSLVLFPQKRFDEAIDEAKTAIELEPASVFNNRILGTIYFYSRRYDQAIQQLERTIELDPNFQTAYPWLIESYRLSGNDQKAFETLLKSPKIVKKGKEAVSVLSDTFRRSGWPGVWRLQLEEIRGNEQDDPKYHSMAILNAQLGNREAAISDLENLFVKRSWLLTNLPVDPRFDAFRSEPAFQSLMQRVAAK